MANKALDASVNRATGSKEDAKHLNLFLDSLVRKVHEARRKLIDTRVEVSSEMIRKVLLGDDQEKE